MTFSVDTLRGAPARAVVDHRLARLVLIKEYKKGRVRRDQICDAHPELLRAAKNVGSTTEVDCPICEESKLILVTYVFGARLPAHGRCIASKADLAQFHQRTDDLSAYVVEACVSCKWHHLLRVLPVGGRRDLANKTDPQTG